MKPVEDIDPALADFRNFLAMTWAHLGLPSPTAMQFDVAHWMQHGPRHLCVQAFRGFGKSWIASTFGIWRLYCDRNRKFLQLGSAKQRADDATRFMLMLIQGMPAVQHLMPGDDQRSSAVQFDVFGCLPAHAPSVRALGILSNLVTGSRCEDFVSDDIETRKNSMTILMRERIIDGFREVDGAVQRSADEVDDPRGIVLGTPQIEDSFLHTLPSKGYAIRLYPARYPTPEQMPIYGDLLAPMIVEALVKDPSLAGQPTEPKRFGEEELLKRRAKYGNYGFLLQFMLMPTLGAAERYPLKIQDLPVMDLDPKLGPEKVLWSQSPEFRLADLDCVGFRGDHWLRPAGVQGQYVPYDEKVMGIDPSGRGEDELGWAIGGVLNSQIFLLDAGGYLGGYTETTLTDLALSCAKWGVNEVIYEDNFGDGMWGKLFEPFLRRHSPNTRLDSVHHSTRKESRIIDTIEPSSSNHRLIINRQLVVDDLASVQGYKSEHGPTYSLFFQFSHITHDKGCLAHEDRLEAVAIMVARFADQMARDIEDEMQIRKEADMNKALEEFTASIVGAGSTKENTWM